MASCLMEKQEDFILEAYGKDKTEAVGKAFKGLQSRAYASMNKTGLIIHMEPEDVEILSEYEQTAKEKVIGFFKPKPIMHYQVKLRVTVKIKYIPL